MPLSCWGGSRGWRRLLIVTGRIIYAGVYNPLYRDII
jgi:hypothetical protein